MHENEYYEMRIIKVKENRKEFERYFKRETRGKIKWNAMQEKENEYEKEEAD